MGMNWIETVKQRYIKRDDSVKGRISGTEMQM
jgi:hypothetical protein